jgi:hypothetical protein
MPPVAIPEYLRESYGVPFNAFELFRRKNVSVGDLAEEFGIKEHRLRSYLMQVYCPLGLFRAVVAVVAPDEARALLQGRYAARKKGRFWLLTEDVLRIAPKFDALVAGAELPIERDQRGFVFEAPDARTLAAAERAIAGVHVMIGEPSDGRTRVRLREGTRKAALEVDKLLARWAAKNPPRVAPPPAPAAPEAPPAPGARPEEREEVLTAMLFRIQGERDAARRELAKAADRSAELAALEAARAALAARVRELEAENAVYAEQLERVDVPAPPVRADAVAAVSEMLARRAPTLLTELDGLPKTNGYAALR